MSIGTVASITPVMPAKMKLNRPPRQNNIGVFNLKFPCHSVPSQANTFTPVGTAINIVVNMKMWRIQFGVPV